MGVHGCGCDPEEAQTQAVEDIGPKVEFGKQIKRCSSTLSSSEPNGKRYKLFPFRVPGTLVTPSPKDCFASISHQAR